MTSRIASLRIQSSQNHEYWLPAGKDMKSVRLIFSCPKHFEMRQSDRFSVRRSEIWTAFVASRYSTTHVSPLPSWDRVWGPTSLLPSAWRGSSWVRWLRMRLTIHFPLEARFKTRRAIPPLHYMPSWRTC